jgi:hypothetical protein
MLEFAAFVDRAFLPSIALGVVLSVAWRYVEVGRFRTALQWIGSLLFFVPQPVVLFLGAYTYRLRLYQQVLFSLWGFGSFVVLVARTFRGDGPPRPGLLGRAVYWRQTTEEVRETEMLLGAVRSRAQKPRSRVALAMAALAMAGLGLWCGWNTVGDYLLPHRNVEGRVEGARVVRGTRSPSTYQVIIDHQGYGITLDLLARVRPGDVVEADVGVASGTIVAIRTAQRPSPAGLTHQRAWTVQPR